MKTPCCKNIQPEKTAKPQLVKGKLQPTRGFKTQSIISKFLQQMPKAKILDYGAGSGRNSLFLKELCPTCDITAYEPFPKAINVDICQNKGITCQQTTPSNQYDLITSNYVINVICEPLIRQELITNLISFLKPQGLLFLEARNDRKAIKSTWKFCNEAEGFITPNSTFQKFFTAEELKELLPENTTVIKSHTDSHHSYLILQKK